MKLSPITLTGIVISMVTGVALGISGHSWWLTEHSESDHARAFDEVLSQVQLNYVEEVGRDELMDQALRGMLDGLDSYSIFSIRATSTTCRRKLQGGSSASASNWVRWTMRSP